MESVPRCAYEHVCSTDGSDDAETGGHRVVWECPHPATTAQGDCQFHAPIEEKNPDETTAALVAVLDDPERPSEFVGAQFESLDLAGEVLGGDDTIDLRDVIVRRDIDLSEATLESSLRLDSASVGGELFMNRLDATADISCQNLQVGRNWMLSDATIDGRLDASGFSAHSLVATSAHVTGAVSFRKGTVDDKLGLSQAWFEGPVSLTHTRVGGRLDSGAAAYDGRLSLSHCTVGGDVVLQDSTTDGDLLLEHLRVSGEFVATNLQVAGDLDARSSQFGAPVDCTELTVTGGRFDCSHATFDGPVFVDAATIDAGLSFQNAQFDGGTVSFVQTAVSGSVAFSDARFTPSAPFRLVETRVGGTVVCTHASFGAEVYWADSRVYGNVDFSDCTVTAIEFGVEIDGGLDFAYTHVSENAGFTETVVQGAARFTSARFDTEPSLTDATLEGAVATYDLSVETLDSSTP